MPVVGSLFSGVGGFDLGFEQAGFTVAWQCEIDRDAASVLERHWPEVPRYGDIATVDPADLAPVDVVIFGSPCQDFSVAGKRAGLDGARSGLFGEAIRIIRGLRPAPAFCLWENVPGALSSARGRDFGAVLDALAGAGALDICWRILDARWFGVPQRRRRLFVVSDLRAERAAEVLFEPQSSGGHPTPSREARQGAARDAEDGAGGVSWKRRGGYGYSETDGVAPTLESEGGSHTGGPMAVPLVAATLRHNTNGSGSSDSAWNTTYVPVAAPVTRRYGKGTNTTADDGALVVANAVTSQPAWVPCAEGCGDFWCRVHEQHAHDCDCPSIEDWDGDPYTGVIAAPLTAGGHPNSNAPGRHREDDQNLIAFHLTQDPINGAESPALGAGTASGCATPTVAISENQRGEVRETLYARQITSGGGKPGQGYPSIREGMSVRRLTPRECERLMGWTDDATRYRADGSEIPDGPRYRMIGNGVVAPVARWLAQRMYAVLEGV